MTQYRPIARLREVFPAELQPQPVRQAMNAPLELRINAKHRLVLSTIGGGVLLEVESPTTREGHNWGLVTQLRLDAEHVAALRAYLAERREDLPPAA